MAEIALGGFRLAVKTRRTFIRECRHTRTLSTTTAGLERIVCEECGHISVRFQDVGVGVPGQVEDPGVKQIEPDKASIVLAAREEISVPLLVEEQTGPDHRDWFAQEERLSLRDRHSHYPEVSALTA